MIGNILFWLYFISISSAVPFSISFKYKSQNNKEKWSQSVFLMINGFEEEVCAGDECTSSLVGYGTGTAFVIDTDGDKTIFMTAAHLCEEENTSSSIVPGMPGLFQVKRTNHLAVVKNEMLHEIEKVLYRDVYTDICIFVVNKKLSNSKLKIAKAPADYGEEVWTIGAPAGYFPPTAKPISRGLYSGNGVRVSTTGVHNEFSNYSLPTRQGMSGSPIMNSKGKVIGIVSAVHNEWHMILFSPTHKQVIDAINSI